MRRQRRSERQTENIEYFRCEEVLLPVGFDRGQGAKPKDNSISLENVRFSCHDKEILHGVNMDLKVGSVNASVGSSGSGKSTIAKLITSLWNVNFGRITIGGVDVKQIPLEEFNSRIAYVS